MPAIVVPEWARVTAVLSCGWTRRPALLSRQPFPCPLLQAGLPDPFPPLHGLPASCPSVPERVCRGWGLTTASAFLGGASPPPAVTQTGWARPLGQRGGGAQGHALGVCCGFCVRLSPGVVAEEAGVGTGPSSRSPWPRLGSAGLPTRARQGWVPQAGPQRAGFLVLSVPDGCIHSGGSQDRGHSSGLPPCQAAHGDPQIRPTRPRAQNPQEGHSPGMRVVSRTKKVESG